MQRRQQKDERVNEDLILAHMERMSLASTGLQEKLTLKLTKTHAFGNGNVLLCYERVVKRG